MSHTDRHSKKKKWRLKKEPPSFQERFESIHLRNTLTPTQYKPELHRLVFSLETEAERMMPDNFLTLYLQQSFEKLSKANKVPVRNPIAFWNHMIPHDARKKAAVSEGDKLVLLLGACFNHGEYFDNNVIRYLPTGFVKATERAFPDDEARESQIKLQKQYIQTSRDSLLTLRSTYDFGKSLSRHLRCAKQCEALLSQADDDDAYCDFSKSEKRQLLHNLKCIFLEYLRLLSEKKNTNHPASLDKAESAQVEKNLKFMISDIGPQMTYSTIAPAYLFVMFVKTTKELYSKTLSKDSDFFKRIVLSSGKPIVRISFPEKPLSAENDLIETNIRYPVQCALILYAMLRDLFRHPPADFPSFAVDEELSNFIIENIVTLIGSQYYDVSAEQMEEIRRGHPVAFKEFSPSSCYVHPLLHWMSKALLYSLNLHPSSIPTLYGSADPDVMIPGMSGKDFKKLIPKEAWENVLEQYRRLLITPPDDDDHAGTDSAADPRFPDLLDLLVSKQNGEAWTKLWEIISDTTDDEYRTDCMGFVERGVHRFCAPRISSQCFHKVIPFLHSYLYHELSGAVPDGLADALLPYQLGDILPSKGYSFTQSFRLFASEGSQYVLRMVVHDTAQGRGSDREKNEADYQVSLLPTGEWRCSRPREEQVPSTIWAGGTDRKAADSKAIFRLLRNYALKSIFLTLYYSHDPSPEEKRAYVRKIGVPNDYLNLLDV